MLGSAAFPDSRARDLAPDSAFHDSNLGVVLGGVSVFPDNTKVQHPTPNFYHSGGTQLFFLILTLL